MALTVRIYVEDITTALEDYTSIRLYRDTSATGSFSTLVTTITLVSGTEEYSYEDTSGSSTSWYRWSFYNTSTVTETAKGPAFRAGVMRLRDLRIETAMELGAGFKGVADSGGTTTTLRDAALGDAFIDVNALEGAWIYRPDAAASGDMVRRVKQAGLGFDGSDDLTVSRAWTNAPSADEEYHVFLLAAPVDVAGVDMSWDRGIREGCAQTWFEDRVNVGRGTSTGKTRFDLAAHLGVFSPEQVMGVFTRYTDSTTGYYTDTDYSESQRLWTFDRNGLEEAAIDLWPPPPSDEDVWVRVQRTFEVPYGDDDEVSGPERLMVAACGYATIRKLNKVRQNRYAMEERNARMDFEREYRRYRPKVAIVGIGS